MQSKISFDQFVDAIYLPFVKTRKRSWAVDERICRVHISKVFGHLPVTHISSQAVSSWLVDLRLKGYAPATCNRIFAVFRSVCTLAQKHEYLVKSPCNGINTLPVLKRNSRNLNQKEACLLMRELDKHNCLPAYALKLLILTGARKSEILRARWENIDWQKKILLVPVSKSGKERQIILSSQAMQILRKMRMRASGPWLFPGRKRDCPIGDIYIFWNKIRCRLGLVDVRIHDLRHSFASFLVNMGHSLFEVQNLLGHANPRTTMRYAHMGNPALRQAVQDVEKVLDTGKERLAESLWVKTRLLFQNICRKIGKWLKGNSIYEFNSSN